MIPPRYDEATISPAERRIFRALEQLPDDYTVFHSLGLANHGSQVYGEVDFVVLCSQGVLCLEVKGGDVHREGGLWIHTNRHGERFESAKSPFVQIIGASNALREAVKDRFGPRKPMGRCCFASGVMFPESEFAVKSPENIQEIIYTPNTQELESYIKKVFTYWRTKLMDMHGFEPEGLSRGNIDCLTQFLRGDFNFRSSLGTAVSQAEEELVYLTDEQRTCLRMISTNPRILLEGGAGTGKTLLSMEHAVERALEGERVLFLCFNHNLAYFLQHHVTTSFPDLKNLEVKVFHKLLEEYLIRLESAPEKNDINQYWTQDLPNSFVEAVSSLGYPVEYDYLVIDEGQDLLKTEYLLCLDYLLKDGFRDGQWLVVFDPNQNLYEIDTQDGLSYLMDGRPARFQLNVNCRNTKQIIQFTEKATGITSRQALQADGPEVKTLTFTSPGHQQKLLSKEVQKLLSQNVLPRDICILSPRRFKNSCLQGNQVLAKGAYVHDVGDLPPDKWDQDKIRFSTLYRFKGLESPVILLIDVNLIDQERIKNYTAMTRAKALLYVFNEATATSEG